MLFDAGGDLRLRILFVDLACMAVGRSLVRCMGHGRDEGDLDLDLVGSGLDVDLGMLR